MNKLLVFVETRFGYACYVDGVLIYEEKRRHTYPVDLLRLLGFTIEFLNVHTHDFWERHHDCTPESLSDLKQMYRKFLLDIKSKRLEILRDEISFLEKELESMFIDNEVVGCSRIVGV